MAVDREFACILFMCIKFCDLLVSFGRLWGSFCFPWGDFGPPFGSLWGALGSQGALLDVTLASRWFPWDHLGRFGLPRGAWDDFGFKMDPNSEQMVLK